MEQKKTLWIIAAVSVFLLVVVGGAALIFNQNLGSTKRVASTFPVEKTTQAQAQASTSSGWTNTSVADTSTSSPTVNDMFVVSENTTVLGFNQPAQTEEAESTTIDLNALKKELAANAAVSQPQNINITVNLSESESQAKVEEPPVVLTSEYYVKSAKEAEASEKAAAVKQTQEVAKAEPAKTTPAATSSSSTKASSAKTSTASTSSVSTKTAATSTTKANPITRFWVQVAAYSNKKTAENARSVLSEKKINSDIYTYEDNKSKLFYRVRVGPFTTKSEAEYWQSKITEISDFAKAGSYVTSTVN
ncbi:MAG: SPOR domain-containing protein [Treponema sp.]|jgi:cell division septation protein DedD|nr:SPOR domain-containing protein [Treponema sp.]